MREQRNKGTSERGVPHVPCVPNVPFVPDVPRVPLRSACSFVFRVFPMFIVVRYLVVGVDG